MTSHPVRIDTDVRIDGDAYIDTHVRIDGEQATGRARVGVSRPEPFPGSAAAMGTAGRHAGAGRGGGRGHGGGGGQ